MAKRGSNIYKRKDGRFEGRVPVGYNESGKVKYRYVYGHSLAEVKEKMAEVYTGQNAQEQSKTKMTVKEISEQWLAEKKLTVKSASYSSYRRLLSNHIYPEFGGIRCTALTKQMLNRFISELLVSGRKDGGGGLSPKTVRDVIIVLKAVFSYAHSEYGFADPTENIRLPRIDKGCDEQPVFERTEQIKLEYHLMHNQSKTNMGILLCLYTGLRIGELCALKWHDIDLANGQVSVTKTIQRISCDDGTTELAVGSLKSVSSIRDVPIPEFMCKELLIFKSSANAYILSGCGTPVEPRTMQNRFKAVLKQCGLHNRNFHSLRHTYATMCIEKGFDPKALSELLGHADVSITMNRYVHSSAEMKKRYVSRLNLSA